MKLLLLSLLCFNLAAATTPAQIRADVEAEIEKIRVDREKALKPARETLLKNLAAEAKQWQAAGKLEMVLAADGRKAELEPATVPPLGDAKSVFLDEHPIHGSKAEEQYKAAQKQVYGAFQGRFLKLDAAQKSVEAMQKQLTIQGKKDDALDAAEIVAQIQDLIADLRIDFDTGQIVFERWYRKDGTNDFIKFQKNGFARMTYGENSKNETPYKYEIEKDEIAVARTKNPFRLKIVNLRNLVGYKIASDLDLQRIRNR